MLTNVERWLGRNFDFVVLGMNRVEIERNELRFGQNGAYGCQKAFGIPPETKNANYTNKNIESYMKIPKSNN